MHDMNLGFYGYLASAVAYGFFTILLHVQLAGKPAGQAVTDHDGCQYAAGQLSAVKISLHR